MRRHEFMATFETIEVNACPVERLFLDFRLRRRYLSQKTERIDRNFLFVLRWISFLQFWIFLCTGHVLMMTRDGRNFIQLN